MISILLGWLLLITAVIHIVYWKRYRPKNIITNMERAFNTGGFTGIGTACITGAWISFGWQLLIIMIILWIIINVSCRLLLE